MATKITRIFSGIQPSGVPHLGNYLGALRNWVELQNSCDNVFYSIVDLHALTVLQAPFLLKKNIREMAMCLLACGVDPNRSILFQQSKANMHLSIVFPIHPLLSSICPLLHQFVHCFLAILIPLKFIHSFMQVPEHCELMWLLSCRTPNGWLNRMTQWKVL